MELGQDFTWGESFTIRLNQGTCNTLSFLLRLASAKTVRCLNPKEAPAFPRQPHPAGLYPMMFPTAAIAAALLCEAA